MRPETRQLLQYLRECHTENKIATYSDMSRLLHMDVQRKERSLLHSALQVLARDHGLHFECEYNKGYRPLLSPEEVLEIKCGDRKRRIKSTATRWRNELETVNPARLTDDGLLQYVKRGLELAVVEAAVGDETEKRIDRTVAASKLDPLECYRNCDVMALLGDVS